MGLFKKKKYEPIGSLQLVAYIYKYCRDKGITTNITKIGKLLYCCHGVMLARYGDRFVNDLCEVRKWGPVFPYALNAMQSFSAEDFCRKATPDVDALPEDVKSLLGETLKVFGKFSAAQLARWTMSIGGPWEKQFSSWFGGMYTTIPMAKYAATSRTTS